MVGPGIHFAREPGPRLGLLLVRGLRIFPAGILQILWGHFVSPLGGSLKKIASGLALTVTATEIEPRKQAGLLNISF